MNHYRNIWARLLHTLLSLINITPSTVKFKWTKTKQDNFDGIKRFWACNTLLTYPNFNERFKMNTDARNFQLGAVISQKGKLIALYGRQITGERRRYIVKERDILSIFEILKEFKTI